MHNITKNIAKIAFGPILLVGIVIPAAFANGQIWHGGNASFNNDPADHPTIQVTNATHNPHCTTCWGAGVSAEPGEEIGFEIYYHNTSNSTANNVSLKADIPSGSFDIGSVTGTVSADNASSASNSVSVSLYPEQSLVYVPGSLKWYPNRSSLPHSLPFGQNGAEIVDNGFSIGNIAPGWNTQGYVVFRAKVGSNASSVFATTNSATGVSENSATLQGSVNTGNSSGYYWFEYGTTNSFGYATDKQSINTGNSASGISKYVFGLQSNTTYYFRAVAESQSGNPVYGGTLSFTTDNSNTGSVPFVATYSATSVNQSSATLEASVNPNGNSTSVWFEYGTTNSFGYSTGRQSIGSGNSTVTRDEYVFGLQSNTTYYFRAVAQNSFGTVYGTALSFTTNQGGGNQSIPSASTFGAINVNQNAATIQGSVNPNGNNTYAWFEYGTTQSLGYTAGYQNMGSYNSGSTVNYNLTGLSPNTTYYYRIAAQNNYGTSYGSILSFATGQSYNQNGNSPVVATMTASSIYQNVALLNGTINPNSGLTTGWFEWGKTASLGNQTASQPMGSGYGTFNTSFALTGLQAGTAYYYRTVAQNPYGTRYGDIVSFTTTGSSYTPIYIAPTQQTVVINNNTAKSGILLVAAVDNSNPSKGDDLVYTITYKNNTSKAINNAVLRIILPSETDYKNANVVPASVSANSLVFNLGNINAGGEGAVSIKMKIKNSVKDGSALVFSTILEYTNYQDKFLSATNYLTVIVKNGESLETASLLSALKSLFGNWLFYVILIIAGGIYLFTYIQGKRSMPKLPPLIQ